MTKVVYVATRDRKKKKRPGTRIACREFKVVKGTPQFRMFPSVGQREQGRPQIRK